MRKGLRIALAALAAAATLACCSAPAHATLLNLGAGSFTPAATAITFDEVTLGAVNPIYHFSALPGLGDVAVSFGGIFLGQTITGTSVVTLANHLPSGPLALDPNGPAVFTNQDAAPGATSPVLSGTPMNNGPISVFFSTPVSAVGLKGGFFDAVHSTSIEAYDAAGHSLGILSNSKTGFEFYGLADASGQNVISGISFYITGNELAGFAIDDLTFGSANVVNPPNPTAAPEPPTWMLAAAGLAGVAALRSAKRG